MRRAGALDRRAFDAVASARLTGFEYVLPRLSRVADHSVLWFGLAAGLGLSRRPRLRRAALRGTIALGLTSPAVNLLGKQAFRRRRPVIELVGPSIRRSLRSRLRRGTATPIPSIRVRRRLPTSPSFPSGHSASAVAFATSVCLEAPRRVAVPVTALAGAVAFSRIYTGAHYPGDVLAGVGLGAAAGLTTRLLWPTAAGPASTARTAPAHTAGDGSDVVAVVNPDAGGGGLEDEIAAALPAAKIVASDGNLAAALEDAARSARVLAVCGGDGTVNAAARTAMEHDLPLLVIPGGTLNHFARALGMETLADALAAYRSGSITRVDVGCVAGEPFLNTASFGAYTELVDGRERLERRIGKWPALVVSAVRVLRAAEPVDVLVDGVRRRIWFAFVGNCRYRSHGGAPTRRDWLDDGVLDVRLVGARRRIGRSRAVAALLIGHLGVLPEFAAWRARRLEVAPVNGAGAPVLRLARDGETGTVTGPVTLEKRPAALAVLRP